MGVSQNDISVSMKNLYAENRKIVDARAMRYFFVHRPVEMILKNGKSKTFVARALKHPARSDYREIRTGNRVYVSGADFEKLRKGQRIRLKYLCTVEIEDTEPLIARIIEDKGEGGEDMIIHWVPDNGIRVRVRKPECIEEGIGEPLIASELGNVVQFERYGFVRIDSVSDSVVVAYFTH